MKIHQASSLVLALELRERLTDCHKETQDRWDEHHRNEPVSHRHPTAFANAVVSAAVSFQLPHPGRAGPSTAPMEASDAPGLSSPPTSLPMTLWNQLRQLLLR